MIKHSEYKHISFPIHNVYNNTIRLFNQQYFLVFEICISTVNVKYNPTNYK